MSKILLSQTVCFPILAEEMFKYLIACLCTFSNAVPHEDGVSDLDEDIVNAKDMEVLDTLVHHVVEGAFVLQSPVEAPVSIWGPRHLGLGLQDNLAVVSKAGDHPLLEELDVGWVHAKVGVVFEKLDSWAHRVLARHDVHDDLTVGSSSKLIVSHLLEAENTLHLNLVECLA